VSVDVTTPSAGVLNVKPSLTGNSAQWLFDHAQEPGIYTWKTSDARFTGTFAVNPPGEEADLLPADLDALAKESSPATDTPGAGPPTIVAQNVPDLLAQLAHRGEGTSLTPGFLALVLMLAVLEALMANRHRAA
jgi:hypothetical protein